MLAAGIDAGMRQTGRMVATADLIIGVTALHYGFSLGTCNVRHFHMIPGLTVLSL